MAEFHAEWLPNQVGQWFEKGVSGGTVMQPLYNGPDSYVYFVAQVKYLEALLKANGGNFLVGDVSR